MKKNFNTPEEMDFLVDLYFLQQQADDEPPTHVGLALALGLSCRQSLYDLQGKDEFTDSVKRARSMIEDYTARRAIKSNGAGAIFLLKNMGYSDKQTIEVDPIKVTISGSDTNLA